MEADKEDSISHYLPVLDDLSIRKIASRDGVSHVISDLCILL